MAANKTALCGCRQSSQDSEFHYCIFLHLSAWNKKIRAQFWICWLIILMMIVLIIMMTKVTTCKEGRQLSDTGVIVQSFLNLSSTWLSLESLVPWFIAAQHQEGCTEEMWFGPTPIASSILREKICKNAFLFLYGIVYQSMVLYRQRH